MNVLKIVLIVRHCGQRNWGLLQAFSEARRHRHNSDQPELCWADSTCYRCAHFAASGCVGDSVQGPSVRREQGFDFASCQSKFNIDFICVLHSHTTLVALIYISRACSTQRISSRTVDKHSARSFPNTIQCIKYFDLVRSTVHSFWLLCWCQFRLRKYIYRTIIKI